MYQNTYKRGMYTQYINMHCIHTEHGNIWMSRKLQWHRQTDFNIIPQFATAKTKLTDNNESKRKINGEAKKKTTTNDKRNRSSVWLHGDMIFFFEEAQCWK